jgi:hypothetical protein
MYTGLLSFSENNKLFLEVNLKPVPRPKEMYSNPENSIINAGS